jgi:hypothetical protein
LARKLLCLAAYCLAAYCLAAYLVTCGKTAMLPEEKTAISKWE